MVEVGIDLLPGDHHSFVARVQGHLGHKVALDKLGQFLCDLVNVGVASTNNPLHLLNDGVVEGSEVLA